MFLKETAKLMASKDWKDRMRAEYYQLVIRLNKLQVMIEEPSSLEGYNEMLELLKKQYSVMLEYKRILEKRARISNFNLVAED